MPGQDYTVIIQWVKCPAGENAGKWGSLVRLNESGRYALKVGEQFLNVPSLWAAAEEIKANNIILHDADGHNRDLKDRN